MGDVTAEPSELNGAPDCGLMATVDGEPIFHGHRRNKNVLTDTEGIAPCDAGARGGRDGATKPRNTAGKASHPAPGSSEKGGSSSKP